MGKFPAACCDVPIYTPSACCGVVNFSNLSNIFIMTVNFYLDSKANKKGEKAIYCFVRGREICKTIYINIGKKINPIYLNKEKQLAKKSLAGHPEFNTYLFDISDKIQKRITILRTQIKISIASCFRQSNKSTIERSK